MLFSVIFELLTLGCAGFGLLYGSLVLYRRHRSRYVHLVLLAMRSIILTRLFFLVLAASGQDTDAYSIGVFGELSTCLFLLTANRAYNPSGEREMPGVPALLAAAPAAVLYLAAAAACGDGLSTLCECAYLAASAPAAYYAAKGILFRRCAAFNAAVLLYLTCWAGYEFCAACLPGVILPRIALVLLQMLAVAAMLPLLGRGLRKWTA